VAYSAQEHGAEVTALGTIGTRQGDLDHRIRQMPSTGTPLVLVDDAGPCGSWRSRDRTKTGPRGWVVAPSLSPKHAGARVNTDRRDAVQRARLMRAGDLTPVSVPSGEAEALRDRSRAREDAIAELTTATFRRNAVVRRQDIRSTGRATGGPAPWRWRAEGVGATPAQQLVFQADVRAVHEHTDRLQRLAHARQEPVPSWRLQPVVEALEARRGVQCTVAVTLVAALGDLTRCETPRHVMTSLGRIPSEDARGERRRQGALTTAGHTHARRAVVEGAWADRDPAHVRRHWPRRREPLPKPRQDLSWQAPVRRCQRYRRLMARGTHANPVVVAMARALAGFIGASAQQVPVTPSRQPSPSMGDQVYRKRRSPGVVPPAMA
jgi:transposase